MDKFEVAANMFAEFIDYCTFNSVFVGVDPSGLVRLYDADAVLALADESFPDYEDPILILTSTSDGVGAIENSLGYIEAGVVDMVM